jgi:hypothetical protein
LRKVKNKKNFFEGGQKEKRILKREKGKVIKFKKKEGGKIFKEGGENF